MTNALNWIERIVLALKLVDDDSDSDHDDSNGILIFLETHKLQAWDFTEDA